MQRHEGVARCCRTRRIAPPGNAHGQAGRGPVLEEFFNKPRLTPPIPIPDPRVERGGKTEPQRRIQRVATA
jgi:hypothetical protein